MTAIQIDNLTFKRGERAVLQDVSMHFEAGKITAIMGPSGCGKTTLLKLIGALLHPDAGKIQVSSQNIHSLPRSQLYRLRQSMGMLYQSGALFTDLSAFDNVAFPLREHTGLSTQAIADIVYDKLNAVGLRAAGDLMPSELSGGMSRRVALARALALSPQIMLYDEPFTGLDPIAMGVIVKLIKQMNVELGMTSLLVSHDVPETLKIADYVYVLADGSLIAQGTPAEIESNSDSKLIQFLKGLPDGAMPFHYASVADESVGVNT